MKFYNREKEIKIINEIVQKSKKTGQFSAPSESPARDSDASVRDREV